MDFVHVLNLLLRETAAPSRTFSTSIWSLAAQSSRRTAQSLFNHGDRFKSSFWKVQPGSKLRIKTKKIKTSWLSYIVRRNPQPSSGSTGWMPVHLEFPYVPLFAFTLVIFMHQFPLTAGLPCCCGSSCAVTLHRPFLCSTKQKSSNSSSKCTLHDTRIHLMRLTVFLQRMLNS